MTPSKRGPVWKIEPIPDLEFHEEQHRYKYQGQWMPYSITRVINTKSKSEMEAINSTKHIWEPRGNTVHDAMEAWHKGEPITMGDYSEWITPCLEDPFWDRWEAVSGGIELSLVDHRYRICGRCDVILQNKKTGELALADYKTQSRSDSKPRNIKPQLGGYLNLAAQHRNTRSLSMNIDRCIGIWIKPGVTNFTFYEAPACITSYLAARDLFFKPLPDF